MRTLLEREFYGYEISKQLSSKGVKLRPNYTYMILAEMEREGLLKSRWVKSKTKNGLERHLYSLSKRGEKELRSKLKESLDLLMSAFVHHNFTEEETSDHARSIQNTFRLLHIPTPNTKGAKLVIAVPFYDPIICFPIYYYAASEAFPEASVYVVKPPEMKLQADRPNLTFLDGWRYDMPLKDGFADYLIINDIPKNIPEEKTIRECTRVLNENGHLLIHLPNAMTEEKHPTKLSFFSFIVNLYYDLFEQERFTSIENVERTLSRYFAEVRNAENPVSTWICASGKKTVAQPLITSSGSYRARVHLASTRLSK
jgi:DNA-binding PadR family transcriptional regulator